MPESGGGEEGNHTPKMVTLTDGKLDLSFLGRKCISTRLGDGSVTLGRSILLLLFEILNTGRSI